MFYTRLVAGQFVHQFSDLVDRSLHTGAGFVDFVKAHVRIEQCLDQNVGHVFDINLILD